MPSPEGRGENFITRPLRRGTESFISVFQVVDVGFVVGGVIVGRPDLILLGILGFGTGLVGKSIVKEKPKTKSAPTS